MSMVVEVISSSIVRLCSELIVTFPSRARHRTLDSSAARGVLSMRTLIFDEFYGSHLRCMSFIVTHLIQPSERCGNLYE